jgi:hypothetical protein
MRQLVLNSACLLFAAMLSVGMAGCRENKEGGDHDKPDESTGSLETGGDDAAGYNLMTIAKDAGPVIVGQLAVSGRRENCMISGKERLTTIWQLIKDYIPNGETQAQCVDGSNMYVSMGDANSMLDNAVRYAKAVTPQAVTSNFDFGDETITAQFNKYYEATVTSDATRKYFHSYAIKHDENQSYGTFGHYHYEPGSNNPRSAQMFYDQVNQTLKVNQAYLVNYVAGGTMTAGTKYNVRISLDADMNAHLFRLKLWKGNDLGEGAPPRHRDTSIIGYGKAEGGYYLFRVCTVEDEYGNCSESGESSYYCFQADANVSTIISMNDSGYTWRHPSLSNCVDYKDELDTMTFYDRSDAANDTTTDFTGTGEGNHKLSVTP